MRTAFASVPNEHGLPETIRLDLVESFDIQSVEPLNVVVCMSSGRAGQLEGDSGRAFLAAYAAFAADHATDYTPGIESAPNAEASEAAESEASAP